MVCLLSHEGKQRGDLQDSEATLAIKSLEAHGDHELNFKTVTIISAVPCLP
tara:strand:+ start:492 stop:644 length:153 start_codon:yes stop_codon:yes gene_type:complete